jgi:hypothetical protein
VKRIVSVGCGALLLGAFLGGCEDSGTILPELRASIRSSVDPERGPAPRAPAPEAEANDPPVAASAASAASAAAGAVVTMGPGAACVTYPDGITTCTGANGSTTRFGGLF